MMMTTELIGSRALQAHKIYQELGHVCVIALDIFGVAVSLLGLTIRSTWCLFSSFWLQLGYWHFLRSKFSSRQLSAI